MSCAVTVHPGSIELRFSTTLKASTIVNAAFQLWTTAATPAQIADAFETIVLSRDYNSISRSLTLHFNQQLAPNTTYLLKLDGLKNAAGTTVAPQQETFTTTADATPQYDLVPVAPIVYVEDHSIKTDIYDPDVATVAANPDFYIVSVTPDESDWVPNVGIGRITVKFSAEPLGGFVNPEYFSVQRKKLDRTPSRWVTVATKVSSDGTFPWVYIDLPSNDATPVYLTSDKTYFEAGYKYRLKISKEVGN